MQKLAIKTYVVLQRMNIPTPEGFNLRVLDVFLTRKKAEEMVEAMPGTFIDKHVATK